MPRTIAFRHAAAALLVASLAAPVAAQLAPPPPNLAKNLKILPRDMPHDQIVELMSTFTRALGVRCDYCHVRSDFSLDDKPTKRKAREMLRMVTEINDQVLANLENRADPPTKVQCFTCHHGMAVPRTLQDELQTSYAKGGRDSLLARYQSLRQRYYGRALYDFGDVPLADVAESIRKAGHGDDALALFAYNVEQNPASPFAKRSNAIAALGHAFRDLGADSGEAAYRAFRTNYGPEIVGEPLLTELGYRFLGANHDDPAFAVFQLITTQNPRSTDALDGMGDVYAHRGDYKHAIESYSRSVAIDSTDTDAKKKLVELREAAKTKPKKARKSS